MSILVALAWLIVSIPAGLRWLRVLQREHYLGGSATRFAFRWWTSSPQNIVLVLLGLVGLVLTVLAPELASITALVVILGPFGLSVRGRTSQLAWTRRLRVLALATGAVECLVLLLASLFGVTSVVVVGGAVVLFLPVVCDVAAFVLAPLERRASERFISQAAERLSRVAPTVVAITGSYGKTSTKNHLTALIGTDRSVVPSPRSFNNRAGLARAINEHLAPGTDVFIAEMGTYGPGEIADMVRWCPPRIAVMTAIGPVHLERFGSLEVTLASKAEITSGASIVVVNSDDPLLAKFASGLSGITVLKASAVDKTADVAIIARDREWDILYEGKLLATVAAVPGVQPSNAACAFAVAVALGIDPEHVAARVGVLGAVENRQNVVQAPSGLLVIDDTFNANPAGAAAALGLLSSLSIEGRRAVVTPGMIELGSEQAKENAAFAAAVASQADVLLVVGKTNRKALLAGVRGSGSALEVHEVRYRQDAVEWVRANLGGRDAVLYENDLPDHYP